MVLGNLSSTDNVHIDVIDDQHPNMSTDWNIDIPNAKACPIKIRKYQKWNSLNNSYRTSSIVVPRAELKYGKDNKSLQDDQHCRNDFLSKNQIPVRID